MTLYLVCDISGSMAELGKYLVVRGVVRAIEQYLRLGHGSAELKLVAWGREARVLDWTPDQEFPGDMCSPRSSANAEAVAALLESDPADRILLMSDGFWSQAVAKVLRRWKQSLPPNSVRLIKIGADANPHIEGADVLAAEDLFAALDGWLEGGVA
jgi:hypothetical protein